MSVFKNIKSLFIIEEEGAPKSASKNKKGKQKQASGKTTSTAPKANDATIPTKGEATTKFVDVLFKAMEKADLEGFDYLEYKKSLQSLAKMPMDEATRYKSSFAMAQTMGVSPEGLVQSAEHYIKVLSTEEQKFEQALHAQKEKQVGNKMKEAEQLQNLIKQKAEQIKKLTEEIEQHQKQVEATNKHIQGATGKIEATKANFIASYNLLVSQIQADVENMKKYLA